MTEITDLMLKEKDPGKLDVSKISAWVFDLDNTIYPAHQSLFPRVASRMIEWIETNFNLDRKNAEELKNRLFLEYGTTINGLSSEYAVDPEDFLSYVHDIDLSDLSYDEELDSGITALPGKLNVSSFGALKFLFSFKIFFDTSSKLFLFIILLFSGNKYFKGSASTGDVAVLP